MTRTLKTFRRRDVLAGDLLPGNPVPIALLTCFAVSKNTVTIRDRVVETSFLILKIRFLDDGIHSSQYNVQFLVIDCIGYVSLSFTIKSSCNFFNILILANAQI